MPKTFSGEIIVNSSELSECIRRVEVIKDSKKPGVRLTLNRDGIILESDSNNQELAKDVLEMETEFDGFEIGVNVNYLKSALSNCASNEVKISITNSSNPIQLVPLGESDVSNIQLLSPYRL